MSIKSLKRLRDMFIPDSGFVLFEADLAGADAQVVAWEAADRQLMEGFAAGLDVHRQNCIDMWGDGFLSLPKEAQKAKRQDMKRATHGTNYVGSARTIATTLGWPLREAERFQAAWFRLHPGIKEWHRRIQASLATTAGVKNAYGYKRTYFERSDQVLTDAVAWIPQSTVAITCFEGARQLERSFDFVEILMQVHDSLVFQIPKEEASLEWVHLAMTTLRNPIPYPNPLTIRWELKCSAESWGRAEDAEKYFAKQPVAA